MEPLAPIFAAAIAARDGSALVAAAEGALRDAGTPRVRTWILEHLAIGHTLNGSLEAAATALAAAPASHPPGVAVEAFVVKCAVAQSRSVAGLPAATVAGDPRAIDEDDPWLEALTALRGASGRALDGEGFGYLREAAGVLGRDGEAARLGEVLLERAPDPDLAFALACAWARAGNGERAEGFAVKAVDLGFRDWERAAALDSAASWRAFERARRDAGGA